MMLIALVSVAGIATGLSVAWVQRNKARVTRTSKSVIFNRAALRVYNVRELQGMTSGVIKHADKTMPDVHATVILTAEQNRASALMQRGFANVPN